MAESHFEVDNQLRCSLLLSVDRDPGLIDTENAHNQIMPRRRFISDSNNQKTDKSQDEMK